MKNIKTIKFLITPLVLTVAFAFSAFAGTAVIQFGDPKVTRDKVFNVACKVKSTDVRLKSADITVQYDANKIELMEGQGYEGGAGTVRITGGGIGKSSGTRTLEYQIKFRALSAGTTNLTIADQEVIDMTDNLVNITKLGTSKITINPSNTQSKNANLKSLEFSPGEIDRTFDPSILTYNTEVNFDVDKLDITALTEDSDAKTTQSGNENFQVGMNKVTIEVTAPDGKTKKQYVINVTKLETGVTSGSTTIVNGKKLTSRAYTITIMSKPEDVDIPSGYEARPYVNGAESIEVYAPVNASSDEDLKVFLVYAMNQNGDVGFYKCDTTSEENTIQRYVPEPTSSSYDKLAGDYATLEAEKKKLSNSFNILFPVSIILAALVVVLLIILIVMIVKSGPSKNNPYMTDDDDDDDDDYFSAKPRKITSQNQHRNSSIDDDDNDDIDDDDSKSDDIIDLG